jgi:hypothetical protein
MAAHEKPADPQPKKSLLSQTSSGKDARHGFSLCVKALPCYLSVNTPRKERPMYTLFTIGVLAASAAAAYCIFC